MKALEGLLAALVDCIGNMPVVVYGDSKLVLDFCNRQARPKKT
jgi:ribonuclease HI